MSAWLKAGLIGAGVLVLLNLIGLIPLMACVTLPLYFLTYALIGVLTAAFMPAPRTAGDAAGQGALAALLAGIVDGITGMIISAVQLMIFGNADVISQLPPEALEQLRAAGVAPDILSSIGGTGGVLVFGSLSCLCCTSVAVVLGAVGGAIYASVKPD
jgi:hypothetical protein